MVNKKEKLKNKKTKGGKIKIMKEKRNFEKGITLIALVITIIVLLILAAVSIATLTGENGILSQAVRAGDETTKGGEKEQIGIAYDTVMSKKLESRHKTDITVDELQEELTNQKAGATVKEGTGTGELEVTFEKSGNTYTVDQEGNITGPTTGSTTPITPPTESTFKNIDTAQTNPEGSMPSGSTVLEADAEKGIVIRDVKQNEWVWVEVPKAEMPEDITFVNETGYSEDDEANCAEITTALKTYSNSYGTSKQVGDLSYGWRDEWYGYDEVKRKVVTEETAESEQQDLETGCGLKLSEYKETYQKMIKSVYNNGGFWIGRYEAGIEGTTGTENFDDLIRISSSNSIDTEVIIQKDAIPYNYVNCSQAETLAKAITPDSSKTSSLLFGIQWDLVCKFLEVKSSLDKTDINKDSRNWGNYSDVDLEITSEKAKGFSYNYNTWYTISGTKVSSDNYQDNILLSTGASEYTKKLNIYDLAGNLEEWTLERATYDGNSPCVRRGGYYTSTGSSRPASDRDYSNTLTSYEKTTFRPTLY